MQHNLCEHIAHGTARRIDTEDVQDRLFNILDKSPNFIASAAPDGTLLYFNQSARALLQLDEDACPSRFKIFDCLTPEAKKALFNEALPATLRDGAWSGPSEWVGCDGQRVPTTQVVITHWNTYGQYDGFSIMGQDMTAHVQSDAALRLSEERSRRLSTQLLIVQEDERKRIAADLHDVIGQSLSLIKLSIDNAAETIGTAGIENARDCLHGLSAKLKDTLAEVRRISMDLRPAILDDLGILRTLFWFFREFEAACRRIVVTKMINVGEHEIPSPLKIVIFRVLQEATTNIVKHSGADRITFSLIREADTLRLSIADNGQGFDPSQRVKGDGAGYGLGLRSMEERALLSGGAYTIESAPGQGTCIRIAWPMLASSP